MDLFGGITTIFNDLSDFANSVGELFSALLDPHTYVRIFFIIFGAALVFCAVLYGH